MGRRKKWKVGLLSGQAAALLLLGVLFFAGSIAGCVTAGRISDPSGALLAYVRGYIELLTENGGAAHVWNVLWESGRFPLVAVGLSLTALGVVGLPILFTVRGFLLCYAVCVFYRMLGPAGLLSGFFLFGLSALIWMPVLFQLGVRGLLGSYGLLRRAMGDGRYPLHYDAGYFACCGICAVAVCLCAAIECLAVPALLKGISGVFFTG